MLDKLPKSVRLIEVGARDGLQNEAKPVPTEIKFAFIRQLAEAGLKEIELTSFVRPDMIPQLSDAKELSALVRDNPLPSDVRLSALVPNIKGMEAAHAAGMKEVAVFVAASEAFSKRNINATIDESFERLTPVAAYAKQQGIRLRGYLSTVFGCPYEGEIAPASVLNFAKRLIALGCYEVSLGDTIGIGTPKQVRDMLALLLGDMPAGQLAMHFHDTRGMAIANILVSLEMGITTFDASAGGLGGCPYAKGASGNVATEDVVYLMQSLGIDTGVSLEKLAAASAYILKQLGRESPSRLHRLLAGG